MVNSIFSTLFAIDIKTLKDYLYSSLSLKLAANGVVKNLNLDLRFYIYELINIIYKTPDPYGQKKFVKFFIAVQNLPYHQKKAAI